MRLLLDEDLPGRLRRDFPECEVFTVREMGWNGITNGKLLELTLEHAFDALLTFDKNLQHQQNFTKYPITVFVLSAPSNTYGMLTGLSPVIHIYLKQEHLPIGPIVIKSSA
jgi:hypothetical protein